MRRDVRTYTCIALGVVVALIVSAVASNAPPAEAITPRGNLAVTATSFTVLRTATYAIGPFAPSKKEPDIAGYAITFPADTDASGAISPGAGDLVTVSPDGLTVTVTFGAPIDSQAVKTFSLQLGGIINPSIPAAYQVTSVTFAFIDGTTQTTSLGAGGAYDVVPPPYLTMTIATPGAGQTVDFGGIAPGVTTAAENVTVTVDSGATYALTRSVAGDTAAMGLSVTGTASGVNLPTGPSTYMDQFTATPPWTTDPDVVLTATVTYSVVQN